MGYTEQPLFLQACASALFSSTTSLNSYSCQGPPVCAAMCALSKGGKQLQEREIDLLRRCKLSLFHCPASPSVLSRHISPPVFWVVMESSGEAVMEE